ncbi:hypothetical protein [Haloferax volcanii]|uniref:Uncharacterized protein n=1 Tax=Haloferax volcanii TaxID=2246 RepID=A0A847TV52_HALVO|nr:hypothetical protein [Haloferax alexandrinus]NLV02918.1 hypothetical protein [Haloferax alexandrinus]
MSGESETVTEETDLLLTHRASRLEDLANNALELIKINLLVLGLFTPIFSALEGGISKIGAVISSTYGAVGIFAWAVGLYICTYVFRRTRSSSIDQFSPLEDAIANDHSPEVLKKDVADGKPEYETETEDLMAILSVAVGLSLSSILLLIFAIAKTGQQSFLNETVGFSLVSVTYLIVSGRGNLVAIQSIGKQIPNPLTWAELVEYSAVEKAIRLSASITSPILGVLIIDYLLKHVRESDRESLEGADIGQESLTPEDVEEVERLAEVMNRTDQIPTTRARLLVAAKKVFDRDPFTAAQLRSALENTEIPVTNSLLERLTEGDLLGKQKQGNSVFLLNQRTDEVLIPNREKIDQELENLLDFIRDHEFADQFVDVDTIQTATEDDSTGEKVDILNSSISELEQAGVDVDSAGRLVFMNAPSRYRLTDLAHDRISSASYELTKIERQEAQQEANKRYRLMIVEPPEDSQGTIYFSEVKPGPEKEFICHLPDAEISEKEKQELTEMENGDRIEVKIRETMSGADVLEEVY